MSKAIKYLTKACNGNFGTGCSNLAYAYIPDNLGGMSGTTPNYNKAIKYSSKGCRLNDGEGCKNLGFFYLKGNGVKQDYIKAKEYLFFIIHSIWYYIIITKPSKFHFKL